MPLSPSPKPPCVLIVDDDPSARETAAALLGRENYTLLCATGGAEVLAHLDDLAPDVILLDVMMPGMDGFEVCRRIKANPRWQHIPIILITALDTKDDIVRGLDAGADEFLPKPVNGPELRARVRSMLRIKQQFDALEETARVRENLSRMIVHDTKNPLTTILMTSFAARQSAAGAQVLKYLDIIEAEARRLDSYMTDLLLIAKMQEGRLVLNRSPVDVVKLLQSAINAHTAFAQARGITLLAELPPESPRPSLLDASLFRRVVDNLLSNALKFSPVGGVVILRVEHPDSGLRMQVLDEGPGVPPEHRQRIFDPFEVISLREQGVLQIGLGLAFCKMVVEAHGGRISVAANQPCGSIFTVEIGEG